MAFVQVLNENGDNDAFILMKFPEIKLLMSMIYILYLYSEEKCMKTSGFSNLNHLFFMLLCLHFLFQTYF